MPNFLTQLLWPKASLDQTYSGGPSPSGKSTNGKRYDGPRIADEYDDFYTKPVYRYENEVVKSLIGPYTERSVVMDLGAGTGLVRELGDPLAYIAVDGSAEMLKVLVEKNSETFTIQADLNSSEGLRQLDETATYVGPFDVVVALWAGHSFHSQPLFNLIYDHLVPNGTIIFHGNFMRRRFRESPPFLDMSEEVDPAFSPRSLREYLTVAGFKDVRVTGFNALPDWISNRLPEKAGISLIRSTTHLPARYHFHGAGIGRKPHDRTT
jgi:SAM-dependent methyltransferase